MLKNKHRSGSENGHLLGVRNSLEGGAHGDLGLAVTDIAAEQAVHGGGAFHVPLNVGDGGILIGSFGEFEGVLELALPWSIRGKREPRGRFSARRTTREACRLSRLAICARGTCARPRRCHPGGRAAAWPLRAIGRPAPGPCARGNVQARVVGVSQAHELTAPAVALERLQPLELPDAVVHVDDVIIRLSTRKNR